MPDTQPQVVNVTTPVSVSPPEKFLFSSPGTWTTWRKRFERYMLVSGQMSKPEEEKINILVYIMGEESEEIMLQFPVQPTSYKDALDSFEKYFIPRRNIIYERFKFHSTIQKPGEPIESFIKNLHSIAEHCNYGTLKEEFIRDRIVVGMLDTKTSERLQLKEQLDLKVCILIVKQAELQASQNKELYNTSLLVNRVQYSSQSPRSEGSLRPRSEGSQRSRSEGSQRGRMNVGTGDKCGFCGLRSHPRDQCPAGKSKCRKCEKSGHWATVCRSSKGHLGVVKCRERAKLSSWWIGLSTQIENLVRNCPQCVENRTNSKEPSFKDAFPNRPWQKIALDLFKSDSWYLIVTDYYSRFFEIFKMTKMTELVIIEKLKELFSRYGISETVRSDNGPQFQTEFEKFAFEYDFCHITSSPYFPQSNGCIKAAVKIAKNLIKKNDDIYLALLSYRTTPLECGLSPSELLYGRKLRTPLPVLPRRLNENINSNFSYTRKEGIAKDKSAKQFDKRHRTRKLSDLAIGDYVWVTDLRVYGEVIKILDEPRSYLIESINSGVYRRNRWHLVPAPYYSESTVTPRWAVPIDNNFKSAGMLPVNREPQVNIGTENIEDTVRQDTNSDVCAPNVSQEEQQDISASVFSPRPKRLIQKPTYLNDYILK
ncbi:hypothetical protein JTB14_011205 [Gonioctena quinquepunctata]|nr:hypothetical protein JTB14_011205 [Gonioctena quinquepunctata]